MRRIILMAFAVFGFLTLMSQDTISIQTLTFDSITTRRGVWEFPDTSHQYRKVLMSYTLKCDPATTADGFNCGEWDYLTYSTIYDHTGIIDSTTYFHPEWISGREEPDSMIVSSLNAIKGLKEFHLETAIDSLFSIDTSIISIGFQNSSVSLSEDNTRFQFLIRDSEFQGNIPDTIRGIELFIDTIISVPSFKIRIKNTLDTLLTEFQNDDFQEVFFNYQNFQNTGKHSLIFHTPYVNDTSSNLLIEISYVSNPGGVKFSGDYDTIPRGVLANGTDNYLTFSGKKFVFVPSDSIEQNISDEITISFWQFGDPAIQPQSDYIFEGRDADDNRVLNVHLPWSNGNVYWDAGNDGGSYDRIYKSANTEDYEGKWNHWALTKNTNSGSMKIYLNGVLWHSGTSKFMEMDGIKEFRIGSNARESSFYDGSIDEFRIWKKELPDSLISQYMSKTIDSLHPYFSDLIAYYDFNETEGYLVSDKSNITGDALIMGGVERNVVFPFDLFKNRQETYFRPAINFITGSFELDIDTFLFTQEVIQPQYSMVYFIANSYSVEPIDTIWKNKAGWNYQYDFENNIVDSIWQNPDTIVYNEELIYYSEPFEVITPYEIGRFITPYGINLSLGPNGFTWMYDITDYAFLLHDSVDLQAGNNQELIDLKFLMIEGTPSRNVLKMDRLWGGKASHKYLALDEDTKLSATKYEIHPDAGSLKLKTRLTGHGHASSNGAYPHCCEWKDNTHYLFVDGAQIESWKIWQEFDCAQNPVFPQGGTWPGAREGWCPGDMVKEWDFDLSDFIGSDSIEIDYDITDVPINNPGMGDGNYVMAFHLFHYDEMNFDLDANITDVTHPSDFGYYSRNNPICFDPKIIIRNDGKEIIDSIKIKYFVLGGEMQEYVWSGALSSKQKETIVLPIEDESFWIGDTTVFIVEIIEVNGGSDDYSANNQYKTHFNLPDIYEENFVIMGAANRWYSENWYEILDVNGTVVHSKHFTSVDTLGYYDTLNLEPGCYTFQLFDEGHDGISYWANPYQGNGNTRFKRIGGGIVKTLEPDFGYKYQYAFSIADDIQNVKEDIDYSYVSVYPNPAENWFLVDISNLTGRMKIEVYNSSGRIINSKSFYSQGSKTVKFATDRWNKGIYFVKISGEDYIKTKKLIVQ